MSVPFARCPAAPTWHGEPGFAFRNGTPGTPAFFFSHPDECGVSAVTHFQTVTRPERSLSFEFRTRGSLDIEIVLELAWMMNVKDRSSSAKAESTNWKSLASTRLTSSFFKAR